MPKFVSPWVTQKCVICWVDFQTTSREYHAATSLQKRAASSQADHWVTSDTSCITVTSSRHQMTTERRRIWPDRRTQLRYFDAYLTWENVHVAIMYTGDLVKEWHRVFVHNSCDSCNTSMLILSRSCSRGLKYRCDVVFMAFRFTWFTGIAACASRLKKLAPQTWPSLSLSHLLRWIHFINSEIIN